jgi:hypothetical protein
MAEYHIFFLRYGWFPPNFGEQNSGVSLGLVHSAGNIIDNEPLDPVVREQKQMTALSEFPSNFAAPSTEANTVKTMVSSNVIVFFQYHQLYFDLT